MIGAHSISYLCVGCCDWQNRTMSVWKGRAVYCMVLGSRKKGQEYLQKLWHKYDSGKSAISIRTRHTGLLCNDNRWISVCTLIFILKGDQRANTPIKSHVSGQVQFFSSFCGALNTLSSAYCTFRYTWISELEHHRLLLSCLRTGWDNFVRNCSLQSCLERNLCCETLWYYYKVSLLFHSLFCNMKSCLLPQPPG